MPWPCLSVLLFVCSSNVVNKLSFIIFVSNYAYQIPMLRHLTIPNNVLLQIHIFKRKHSMHCFRWNGSLLYLVNISKHWLLFDFCSGVLCTNILENSIKRRNHFQLNITHHSDTKKTGNAKFSSICRCNVYCSAAVIRPTKTKVFQ